MKPTTAARDTRTPAAKENRKPFLSPNTDGLTLCACSQQNWFNVKSMQSTDINIMRFCLANFGPNALNT